MSYPCLRCGGDLREKEVEKLLRGGVNTAVVKAQAEVCLKCGERYYSVETITRFEQIRHQLAHNQVTEFELIGQTFTAVV